MVDIEREFAQYLNELSNDADFTEAEAKSITISLQQTRELHLCRLAEFYSDEAEDGDPEYALFSIGSSVALEVGDDMDELLSWAAGLGLAVRPHLYPQPWAGGRPN